MKIVPHFVRIPAATEAQLTALAILFLHNGFHDNIRIESLQHVHHLPLPGRFTIV